MRAMLSQGMGVVKTRRRHAPAGPMFRWSGKGWVRVPYGDVVGSAISRRAGGGSGKGPESVARSPSKASAR